MSKIIKTPYVYKSDFFGVSKKYRWLGVIVGDTVAAKSFVADMEPHSVPRETYFELERDCAKIWLKDFWINPRDILSYREAIGILTIMDIGVPDFIASNGGTKATILHALNNMEPLTPEDTAVFIAALTNFIS